MKTSLSSPATGTTLEILAPYLSYGINLQITDEQYFVSPDCISIRLSSVDTDAPQPLIKGVHYDANGRTVGRTYYSLGQCLPILRSFADLCTPLEDGMVPAAEVAKMLDLEADYDGSDDAWVSFYNLEGELKFQIHDDWMWKAYASTYLSIDFSWPPADVVQLLRKMHFAVGLTAEQYIGKEAARA